MVVYVPILNSDGAPLVAALPTPNLLSAVGCLGGLSAVFVGCVEPCREYSKGDVFVAFLRPLILDSHRQSSGLMLEDYASFQFIRVLPALSSASRC